MLTARPRRKFKNRGLQRKPAAVLKKLRAAKRAATGPGVKPAVVRTHLRNMIVMPEMIGSVLGIYNGKTFNAVEIKPEMVGYYTGEFSITYKPASHGKAGMSGAGSRFIPI